MPGSKLDDSIRAVFFDAVGTLLLPAVPVAETYHRIACRHGADLDEALLRHRLLVAFQKQEMLDQRAGWMTSEAREFQRWQEIVQEVLPETIGPEACFAELWSWYRFPAAWSVPAEADAVLQALSGRGLVLGMASNFDSRLLGLVAGLPTFAALGERCVVSSLVGWRKPSAEFFQEVIRQAGCEAEQILFVGDDLRNDYEGARRAGLRALLLDSEGKVKMTERIGTLAELV